VKWVVAAPGPQFSVQDVYVGWCEGLRSNGQHVAEFNLDDRLAFYSNALIEQTDGTIRRALDRDGAARLASDGLRGMLYQVQPDVLLVVSAFFVNPAIMDEARARGTKVVIIFTESPYEDDKQLKLAEHADLVLLNDPTSAERFDAVTRTLYVPHAYRPGVHYPTAGRGGGIDFAFVGTGYPSRVEFLTAMQAAGRFDDLAVTLAGHWQGLPEDSPLRQYVQHDLDHCVDNIETADIYRGSRVGMNLYRREADRPELSAGLTMGPREVEMAACGLFFLRERRPEGDSVLHMLPRFDNPDEAGELLHYYLRKDDVREDLARQAREAVADLTFHNHAAHLVRLLE
jgi:spore maturation protein CgeB